jgi:hypothetical protein
MCGAFNYVTLCCCSLAALPRGKVKLLAPQAPHLLNSIQQLLDREEKQKQQTTELE